MTENDKNMKRPRAVSAKASAEKNRPLSGKSNRNMNKIEFIQNMYGGILSNTRKSDMHSFKLGSNGEEHHVCRRGYSKICKEKEELLEENMQLKTENTKLKEKLSHQKNKIEAMRIKLNQETKGIGVQFQKQAYWSGSNANMVRGLKNQYWQLKQKYQQKCGQFDLLTQQFQISKSREQAKYITALQNEIDRLKKRLSQLFQQSKLLQHNTITTLVEYQSDVDRKLKLELLEQNERLSEYLKQLKDKRHTIYVGNEEKEKKIKFLDKLLLEKGNSQHAALRRIKQLEREKQDANNEVNEANKQKDSLAELYEGKIRRLKDHNEKQFDTERAIFKNQLVEKSDRIAKLEKQLAYTTTLLSYWKPIDDGQDLNSNMFLLSNPVESEKQIVLEYSMNSTVIKYSQSRHHSKIPSQQQEEESETKSIVANSRKGSVDQGYRNVSDVMTKSIDVRKGPEKKREQITADKRNTEEGVKSRKVEFREVQDIFETLKYRFIGLGIAMEQIRRYFDYNELYASASQEKVWEKQYITMREVEDLLKNQTFGLTDNDARLLSRFLIESSNCEEVYCDPNNQNLRTIVKSIIHSKVGQYSFPKNKAEVTARGNDLIQKFQTNLDSALRSTYPKGLVSKRKLLELFKGLGIELTRELQDYFIGKIIIKSENLVNLRYKVLFQK